MSSTRPASPGREGSPADGTASAGGSAPLDAASSDDAASPDDVGSLVDLVAERALACPAVVSLAGGVVGQVATYLPGRRVLGVGLTDSVCEVSVVVRLGDDPLPAVADQVRQAVAAVVGDRAVDVLIDDVVLPCEGPPHVGETEPVVGLRDAPHRG